MRITIVGGSKGTGARLAEVAQSAGHEVTALSRSGSAPSGVRAVRGSATDLDAVRGVVEGADAVVVTVGGAKGAKRQRTEVTRTVVAAMQQADVRRLLVQSSLGAGGSAGRLPFLLRVITPIVLAAPLADHDAQEAIVRDWTVIRPSGLTAKPASGSYRALRMSDPGKLHGSISRGDVAACMLASLQNDSTIGAALGVSGR